MLLTWDGEFQDNLDDFHGKTPWKAVSQQRGELFLQQSFEADQFFQAALQSSVSCSGSQSFVNFRVAFIALQYNLDTKDTQYTQLKVGLLKMLYIFSS